jgi:hypothetical protein
MKLQAAREKRGWTPYAAAKRMRGVSESSLRNLESTPDSGSEVKLRTALEIVRVFWPDVQLGDLMCRKSFYLRISPRDARTDERLRYGA